MTALKKYLLLLCAAASGYIVQAQKAQPQIACSISGTSPVTAGNTYTYTLSGSCSATGWTTTCGTVTSHTTTSATIDFNQTTCSSATITATGTTATPKVVTVNQPPALVAGTISDSVQFINDDATPAELTASVSSGGCGSYTYYWYSSTDNVTFSAISGANGQNYQPGALTVTTWFKRWTYCPVQNIYTNTAKVTVYPQLVAGSISLASAAINDSATDVLTVTGVSGGSGTYTYQWYSNATGSYQLISGATSSSYTTPRLTASTSYYVTVTSNGVPESTAPVTATVYPNLVGGSVSAANSAINYNTTDALTLTGVSGGNGSYTYQWYSNATGSYQPISMATGSSYTTNSLTSSTSYYVMVTSNGVSRYTTPVTVTVYPQLVAGTLSPVTQTVGYAATPATLTLAGTTGGTGVYTYQWQSSATSGGSYSPVSGSASSLTPPITGLSAWYEVVVSSNGVNMTSAPVKVTVQLSIDSIGTGANTTLIIGSDPGSILAKGVHGGTGSYVYQWLTSSNDTNWTSTGAVGSSFDPGTLFATAWFRVVVSSDGMTDSSSVLTVTVLPPINAAGVDTIPAGTATAVAIASTYSAMNYPDSLNYVRTRTIIKSGITDTVTADGLTSAFDAQQSTVYYDGFGRSIETVNKQANPAQQDLITATYYDQYGRVSQQYLPYTDSLATGTFRSNVATSQPAFYNTYFNHTENYYYSNTTYEMSPLDRPILATPPGNSWTGGGRGTTTQYLMNTANDSIPVWTSGCGELDIPVASGTYATGTLSVAQTTDENGNTVRQYTDMDGQVILKKVQESASPSTGFYGWLCTIYVYDDFHHLRCVIPPKATAAILGTGWALTPVINLCFQYAYDGRGRMILKKVPDANPVYMVYNVKDLLVLTQDGNLRGQNQWLVTQYDTLDRAVQTGQYAAGTTYTLDSMQSIVNLNPAYPASFTANTRTFYDNYTGTTVPSYTGTDAGKLMAYPNSYPDPVAQSSLTNGLPTISQTRILEGTGTQWLTTVEYYDQKGRVIQSISNNISGSSDTTTTEYDFSGKAMSSYTRHNNTASTQKPRSTVLSATTYDHLGRMTVTTQQLDDNGVNKTIDSSSYDALGQLKQKSLGSGIETLNNEYNIRGWLRGTNRDYITGGSTHYFGMELNYDYGFGTPQYNGNIAGMKWKSVGDGTPRAYGYGYDMVNRLVFANFQQDGSKSGNSFSDNPNVDFDVPLITYDANGNIQHMQQNGLQIGSSGPIDQLTYTYSDTSNQLLSVSDAVAANPNDKMGDFQDGNTTGNDYAYDANGNLRFDLNKHIDSIRYNYLNLPDYIHINGKGTINYVYDAGGTKYQKIVSDSTRSGARDTTTYIGSFVYHSDTLQFVSHAEGRARYVTKINQVSNQPFSGFIYDYFLRDHLGNTRMVLTEEQDTTVYAATMEADRATIEDALFNQVTQTQYPTPAGFEPSEGADTSNHFVSRLNGNPSASDYARAGPSIVLKVMARDTLRACVYGWYQGAVQPPPSGATPIVNDLLSLVTGGVAAAGAENLASGLTPISNALSTALSNFVTDAENPSDSTTQPKAFLNWVLFDNQLNYVTGGVTQMPAIAAGASKQVMQANIPVASQSGYLYIYLSNESAQDVFFDNLNIQYRRGPLLEENHYYPGGLTMAGISDKALKSNYAENKYRFNKGSELQNKEFSDLSGLELYMTNYRLFDPQLVIFRQIDPLAEINEDQSTYSYAQENPVLYNDPFGLLSDSSKPQVLQTATVTGHTNSSTVSGVPLMPFGVSKMATDNVRIGGAPKVNSTLRFISAAEANAGMKEPAYAKGTTVTQFRTTMKMKFVRVFNPKNGNSALGKWMMKESEIQGLSPEQIQQRFALPGENAPSEIVEIEVPQGTLMQVGYAGTNSFGTGGGVQFEAMEAIPGSSFGIPTALPVPSVPMEMPPMEFPSDPIIPEGDFFPPL